MVFRILLAGLALALLAGCGSDKPDSQDSVPPARETFAPSSSPSSGPALDTISYDGTVVSGAGPGSRHQQRIGIFCTGGAGEDCNLTGLSVGNHDVVTLERTGPGSFTADLPAKPSTCTTRGTSAVTGTIDLDGRSMAMTLRVSGEAVKCPDGVLTYEQQTVTFNGQYVDGGLPGFTVDARRSTPRGRQDLQS